MTFRFAHLIVSSLLCLILCPNAYAQFASGRPADYYTTEYNTDEVYVLYRPTFVSSNRGFWDSSLTSATTHGVGLGYEKGFCLDKYRHIYINAGLNACISFSKSMQFYDRTDSYYQWYRETANASFSILSFKLPVGVSWKLPLQRSGRLYMQPYVGAVGTLHLWGKGKVTMTNNYGSYSQTMNLLQTDMWHTHTCNIFNVGISAGCSVIWNRWTCGIWYVYDFLNTYHEELYDGSFDIKCQNLEMRVGYRF